MTTLINLLTSFISYDSSFGIYAEKIDGKFAPESPARFGQKVFDNGGLLDNCEFFASNDLAADFIDEWIEGDADFVEEAAEMLIYEINTKSEFACLRQFL